MFPEEVVPGNFQVIGEAFVIMRQPRDLVQQHDGRFVVNLRVEPPEGVGPAGGRRGFRCRLVGQLTGEGCQLVLVRQSRLGPPTLDFDKATLRTGGKYLDESALADASAPPTGDQRGGALAKQGIQLLEEFFSTEKHSGSSLGDLMTGHGI